MTPILVTGAAGRVGGVGRTVVELLRQRGLPVRAMVHREDARAVALRATGAEVVVGDLTRIEDVSRALDGVRRVFFAISVSSEHLQATVTMAALARALGDRDVLVNVSQMTVSQMSATRMTDSPQQRQDWLGEQVLNGSGLPVVQLRPTVFLDNPLFLDFAAESIAEDSSIRLPFGAGRTSPVSASDVAQVAAAVLADPAPHVGRVYELTGPRSEDMHAIAAEYSSALGRSIRYADVPFEEWRERVLRPKGFPEHLAAHITTMVRLHAENRYDRLTHDVETITGHPATTVRDFVAAHGDRFRQSVAAAART
jgi:NAD(P)H dehydrogenase (quinone)